MYRWPVLLLLILPACVSTPLSMGRGMETWKFDQRSEKKEEQRNRHEGAPALFREGDKITNIRADGPVTIHPGAANATSGLSGMRGITPELLEALAGIRMSQTSTDSSSAQMTASTDYHRKWHTISAIVVGSLCVLIGVIIYAAGAFRREVTKWGFEPKTVGKIAKKLTKLVTKGAVRIGQQIEYLEDKITTNNLPEETKAHMRKQKNALLDMKREFDKVEDMS